MMKTAKDWIGDIAFIVLAFVVLACVNVAQAQETVIVPQNNYQAYVAGVQAAHKSKSDQCDSKTNALKASAGTCKDDICRLAFGILIDKACGEVQSGNVATLPVPQEEKSLGEKIVGGIVGFAQAALPWVDRFLSYKTTKSAQEYAYKGQEALYGMFSGVHGQTVAGISGVATAGFGANQNIANGGFGAVERTAAAAFKAPTYSFTVNGSDNNLFGSMSTRTTTTTTNTNNCTGGSTTTTGTTTPAATGAQVPCTISK